MTPASSGWTSPPPPPRARDGRSPIERYAIAKLRADVAAMPASDVVQIVLWPDTLAGWARESAVATAVAYNMLSRFKPYRRVRELLARRLDAPGFVLDHLIDASRPLPSVLRLPAADYAAAFPDEPPLPPRGDAVSPTVRLPAVRDGSNPIEQRAVWRAWRDVAALPASVLVQIALFPETLAEWARRHRVPPPMLYAMLAGAQPHAGIREALARRLGVGIAAVDALVDAERREPMAPTPIPLAEPPLADRSPAPNGSRHEAASEGPPPDSRADGPPDQLSLGF
ncbi:MAG TPA: hypothetical protein VGE02_12205 [Gemmatimonadales bacterium]